MTVILLRVVGWVIILRVVPHLNAIPLAVVSKDFNATNVDAVVGRRRRRHGHISKDNFLFCIIRLVINHGTHSNDNIYFFVFIKGGGGGGNGIFFVFIFITGHNLYKSFTGE